MGVSGAAEGAVEVDESLSVVVKSTVGLMVGSVFMSDVVVLSFGVPGLVVVLVAVGPW